MDDTQAQPHRFPIVALALVLVVFYPLSVGPMVWLVDHGHLGEIDGVVVTSLAVFYMPLEQLHSKTEVGRVVLDWYLEWWR
jgi:hypothetical protein